MSTTESYRTLEELNKALIEHQQWFNEFLRILACMLPYENSECRLSIEKPEVINAHQALHKSASKLHKNSNFSSEDYDNFIACFEKFKTAIYTFKEELENASHNQKSLTAARITMLPVLREQQTAVKRQAQSYCIAIVDIDLLNKIKDYYGIEAKNTVIVSLANFLVEHVRSYDKVFCYNNEAFLISLQQVDTNLALILIDRLRIKISNMSVNIGLKEPLSITVSCGITALDTSLTVEQSLEQAEIALYLAKNSGGNNSKIWNR